MYHSVKHNVKNKEKIIKFEEFFTYNITSIYYTLNNKKYTLRKYSIFLIKKPKYRIVMAQNIRDKIINHLVAKYLIVNVVEKSLINSNVATRKNKGTHYGMKLLKKYFVKIKKENKDIYALKLDIHKFFYSIDHNILKEKLRMKIKDKDALDIIFNIIDSTNCDYVNKEIKRLKEKEISLLNRNNIKDKYKKIEELNRIPYYEKKCGLPIGNMTSQILAIFYLSDFDHFIKEELLFKYYIRYQDDMVILSTDKEYLISCISRINEEIRKCGLRLNNKSQLVNASKNGIDFLGFHYYIRNQKVIMKLRNNTKYKLRRAKKTKENKDSYYAHLKHGNCHNLYKKYMG